MRTTAPNKEITAQALGAAVVAFCLGAVQWHNPSIPAPPPGFEAGAAVLAGVAVAFVRKFLNRRKMTETEIELDKALQDGRVYAERRGGDGGDSQQADKGPRREPENDRSGFGADTKTP